MQQHAQARHRGQPTGAGGAQQRRLQRHIDGIGHHGMRGQGREVDLQRRLAGHAQAGGIDQQGGGGEWRHDGGADIATDGAGQLVASSVERSNVDIASEFTKLIVAQRAYTANTKVVTTADELLQDTINMKR
jgi:flagellar basal body rod protein FlgG